MSDNRWGCGSWFVAFVSALMVTEAVEAIGGRPAVLWFGAGFIVAVLVMCWEAGRAKGDTTTNHGRD